MNFGMRGGSDTAASSTEPQPLPGTDGLPINPGADMNAFSSSLAVADEGSPTFHLQPWTRPVVFNGTDYPEPRTADRAISL